MKTIANCNPIEFLQQTNKVKKAVEKYLKDTDVLKILRTQPDKDKLDEQIKEGLKDKNLTADAQAQVKASIVAKARREQSKININNALEKILEEKPRETAEILGLLCFVEPEDIESYKGVDFLLPAMEILQNEDCLNFLMSAMSLEQIPGKK